MGIEAYKKINNDYLPLKKKAAIAGVFLLASGSGSSATIDNIVELHSWNYDSSIEVKPFESRATVTAEHKSSSEHLNLIRDISGLSLSSIANIFGVSRPTVYAWINGSEPKTNLLPIIEELSNTIGQLKNIQAKYLAKLILRPMFDGESLIDKIKQQKDVDRYIQAVTVIADKESNGRQQVKGSINAQKSFKQVASDYSRPVSSRS